MKSQAHLHIDTTKLISTTVYIDIEEQRYEKSIEKKQAAQDVLAMFDTLLCQSGCILADITSITVNMGPGSFTGTRVGIAISHVLGKLLEIPVNDKEAGRDMNPIYEPSKWDEEKVITN